MIAGKKWIWTVLLLVCLVEDSFSESDQCPSATRPHSTLCTRYFQCLVLPSGRIIWVSRECDEGLIYDSNIGKCVVPYEDWECEVGDLDQEDDQVESSVEKRNKLNDQENIYGVDNLKEEIEDETDKDHDLESHEEEESGNYIDINDRSNERHDESTEEPDEYSGDGTTREELSKEDNSIDLPTTPDPDGALTGYLQRLTQLIDGLRKSNTSSPGEPITPDKLNSFVILHKIKSNKNYNPIGKIQLPEDGKIHPTQLDYIINKQNSLKSQLQSQNSPVRRRIIHIIRPYHQDLPKNTSQMVIKSSFDGNDSSGNAQIVVNRPEGSVMFNVAKPTGQMSPILPKEPSISEQTLNSVLELSKQLVSHQQLISEKQSSYLQPVVQPVYYTVPVPVIKPNLTDSSELENRYKSEEMQSPSYHQKFQQNNYQNNGPNYGSGEDYSMLTPPRPQSNFKQNNQWYRPPMNNFQYSQFSPGFSSQPSFQSSSEENNNYNRFRDPPQYDQHGYLIRPPHNYNSQLSQQNYDPYNQKPFYNQNSYSSQEQNYNPNPHKLLKDAQNFYQDQDSSEQEPQYPEENMESEDYESELSSSQSSEKLESKVEKKNEPLSSLKLLANQLFVDGSPSADGKNKIININGNYMSYKTYRDTVLPLLTTNPDPSESNVEVITCSAGVRHPNTSDCTRYYVCNPHTGGLLGYNCPSYTAFNEMTRICDAKTYSFCKGSLSTGSTFSMVENQRIQYEAQKTLQEAKRIREQALKAQRMAEMAKIQSQQTKHHKIKSRLESMENQSQTRPHRRKVVRVKTKVKAGQTKQTTTHRRPQTVKKPKRVYRCMEAGAPIPDSRSNKQYYTCYRGDDNKFRRHPMTCSDGLIFCKSTRLCTLKKKCPKNRG